MKLNFLKIVVIIGVFIFSNVNFFEVNINNKFSQNTAEANNNNKLKM